MDYTTDIFDKRQLKKIAGNQRRLSNLYRKAREEAATAKADLMVLLASKIKPIRMGSTKSIGKDMAIVELMADPESNVSELAKGLYKRHIKAKARYKGLERIIESNSESISLAQSQMKFLLKGGGDYGC